jgi:hypothetical protein
MFISPLWKLFYGFNNTSTTPLSNSSQILHFGYFSKFCISIDDNYLEFDIFSFVSHIGIKLSMCTLPCQELSTSTRNALIDLLVGEIHNATKNKT